MTNWQRALVSVGGALLLVLVLAVGVRADAPATTFYACVNNSSGTIHLVSATDSCATASLPVEGMLLSAVRRRRAQP